MNEVYEVISKVKVRREPRVVEYLDNDGKFVTNAAGILDVGTKRVVYSVITNSDNTTWGRISEADAAGISQWVCIHGLNRDYLKPVDGSNLPVDALTLEQRVSHLESWAKSKGYQG